MKDPVITVATDGVQADGARRWWAPVAARWPQNAPPGPDLTTVDRLMERLGRASSEGPDGSIGPALVVLGPDTPRVRIVQLADALQGALAPAVLLLPTADEAARRLQGSGLIVESHDADPALLAAMLFALAQRQSAVRDLARDLRIAARYEGGVRGEIDRIHDELNLAASVQQELLPKSLPRPAGLECGALFRPVGYVSGDIYDFAELGEHHLGVFIADAVGHGVPAALLTMVISRSLRSALAAGEPGRPLRAGEVLARINDDLVRGQRGGPARFATAVYALVDTRTRRVSIAGGGHPFPLRLRRGHVEPIETDGPLLGVFGNETFNDVQFTLEPGETLLLYSDGFETAFPDAGGQARRASKQYLAELAALAWPDVYQGGTLAAAIDELADRLDRQAGSLHQVDDVTAVAIAPSVASGAAGRPMAAQAA